MKENPPSKSSSPQPIWSKRVNDQAGKANVAYCAGRDVTGRPAADSLLIQADLWTNRAHAVMLARQGILEPGRAAAILRALEDIHKRAQVGDFLIPPESEDVHMAIEQEVTRMAGPDSGGWLHAGRSRNDQTATDCRLWIRDSILDLGEALCDLGDGLVDHATLHTKTVCPGFTHMQPAMATTWGHIVASWSQGLQRDLQRLEDVYRCVNRSPLGAAASFGTSWPIDREFASQLLGFDSVQENTLDCVSSRGEMETQTVVALAMVLDRLSGIGQDLILFSSPPRRWIRLDDRFVTGSSIMPQKRNPDFAEVTRAKAAVVAGIAASLFSIGRAAPSGYNRDTQWTKYQVMDAFSEIDGAPTIFLGVFQNLMVDSDRMKAACYEGFLNAAEIAEFLASQTRIPFRSCYRLIAEAVGLCESVGVLRRDILNEVLRKRWSELETPGASKKKVFQITAAQWGELDSPLQLVSRRRQSGAPNPEAVEENLARIRRSTAQYRRHFVGFRRGLIEARKRLDREIKRFLH